MSNPTRRYRNLIKSIIIHNDCLAFGTDNVYNVNYILSNPFNKEALIKYLKEKHNE